jgi:hypothetical protein
MNTRHESTVNFQNLIRDLADMYPQEVDEVVVVELIANSLDAGANRISIDYNPSSNVLVIIDNGQGMDADQFAQYHDFAAGLKTRGTGIGFAGVGAKISFNAADRVITETVGQGFSGGSNWHFEANGHLFWDEIQVTNVSGHGTRVEVHFRADIKPSYATTDDLVKLLQRNYLPLLDGKFLDLYQRLCLYSKSLRFVINGKEYCPTDVADDFIQEAKRDIYPESSGKMLGYGVLGLASHDYPLGEDIGGVLLCTHGKVIRADLFNQFPGNYGPRVFGVIEIPGLIDFITTSKTDFNRGKGRNRSFERLYGPLRENFKDWLTGLGIEQIEPQDTGEAGKLERELRQIAESVPELSEFFGFRNRTTVLQPKSDGKIAADLHDGIEPAFPEGEGTRSPNPGPPEPGDKLGTALIANKENGQQRANPISRRGRRGPRISFESRLDRIDLAWVDGNTVVINSGHPSYKKTASSATARRIHSIFAIASAIQKFIADPDASDDLMFVDRMLSAWGEK